MYKNSARSLKSIIKAIVASLMIFIILLVFRLGVVGLAIGIIACLVIYALSLLTVVICDIGIDVREIKKVMVDGAGTQETTEKTKKAVTNAYNEKLNNIMK